jgi:hypothetical protein
MSIDRVGKELEALGVSGGHVRCLLLLPQVYVGWASRQRDLPGLEALLESTASRAHYDRICLALARAWLFEEPTRAQFQSGFALLRGLRRSSDAPLVVMSDVLESMLWACWAAQLDREPATESGSRGSVTLASRQALTDLEAWLEMDTGDLWTNFLREGGDDFPATCDVREEGFDAVYPVELQHGSALRDASGDEHSTVFGALEDCATPASEPFHLVQRPA